MGKTTVLIERRASEGAYGIIYTEVIVNHHKHGLLYIAEGFGGGDLEGQTYRWRHGLAIRLQPGDTLASLDQPGQYWETILSDALHGHDDARPILDLPGTAIAAIASAAGLCD